MTDQTKTRIPAPLRAPPQCEGCCYDETNCSHVRVCRAVYEAYQDGGAVDNGDGITAGGPGYVG